MIVFGYIGCKLVVNSVIIWVLGSVLVIAMLYVEANWFPF